MTQDIGPEEQPAEAVPAPVDAPEDPVIEPDESVDEAEAPADEHLEEQTRSDWRTAVRAIIVIVVILLILLLCRCGTGGLGGKTDGTSSTSNNVPLPALTAEESTEPSRALDEEPVVPDVIGMTRSAAIAAIEAAGFRASITDVYGTTKPANTVFQQHPSGGSALEQGGTVGLLVQSRSKPTVPAPDVVGLKQAEAERRIRAAGLLVTLSYSPANPRRKAGTVVSQWPLPGKGVLVGGDMQIQIAVKP